MIKFTGSKDGVDFLGLGLSAANCRELLNGRPIIIQLSELGLPWKGEILIMGGVTEEAMTDELMRLGVLESARIHIEGKALKP